MEVAMAIMPPELLDENHRNNWVRLRTLIVLRWFAVGGQLSAILLAQRYFDLELDLGLCFMAIGASVVANLIAIFVYPENKRLSELEVMLMLIFDMVQLSSLLYLTGGLNNPFALLILAPVTISATALRTGPTIVIGGVAIALITFVMWFFLPLRTNMGFILRMPQIFVFGFWTAIVIGVGFLGAYARRVSSEVSSMSEALLAVQMALAREQKISDLAGVVAATAHELGTPLATIKLTSSELAEELADNPVLCDDARLIGEQADRCSDILHSMGRAGKDDLLLRQTPLCALLQEAGEPHMNRGVTIIFSPTPAPGALKDQPMVWRRPEIIHGIRNLIQNAVDFAESTVWVDASCNDKLVTIRIIDDGRGFSQHVIGRIGDPYVSFKRNAAEGQQRPEYKGMGLGLFIAKTLLERSGAELSFANASDAYSLKPEPGQRCGAIVEVIWPVSAICVDPRKARKGLGENQPLTA
jgi:two-component system, sensor histidine kinase RegB